MDGDYRNPSQLCIYKAGILVKNRVLQWVDFTLQFELTNTVTCNYAANLQLQIDNWQRDIIYVKKYVE